MVRGSLLNQASVSTATYTDTTPTVAEFVAQLEPLVRSVELGYGGAPVVIMHPRRLSWIRQSIMGSSIPLNITPPAEPWATVTFNGSMNVIASSSVPTNLGASTNEDRVIVLRSLDSVDCWATPAFVTIDTSSLSSTMQARVLVRRYFSFSCGRLPATVGVMSGTGLTPPT